MVRSRRPAVPSRHRLEFGAVRTVSSESSRDSVRTGSLKDQRPRLMEMSHINEVEAPQHVKTRRSHSYHTQAWSSTTSCKLMI